MYNLRKKKLMISQDVEFDENAAWNWDEKKVEKISLNLFTRTAAINSKTRTNRGYRR